MHSTGSWSTSRTTPTTGDGGFYQGDYIVNGALGRAAPASDLPLPTTSTRESQLSAPASLPPLHHHQQQSHRQQPQPSRHHNGGNNGHHHHNRHYQQQQLMQAMDTGGRSVPRRRSGGPGNKHIGELEVLLY